MTLLRRAFLLGILILGDIVAQEGAGKVADTKISIDGGFYAEPIEVVLSTATEGARILYTTDGSEPDLGNLFTPPNGKTYEEPVVVSSTTVLRVRAFHEEADLEPTNTDTRTYLFLDEVIRQTADIEGWPRPELSVGQGRRQHDYEMDPRIVGEGEQAEAVKASLLAIPTMSLVVDQERMWDRQGNGGFYRGDTEEAVHLEIFYPDDENSNERARGAVQGHSHDRLKRSLRLKFKAEFGDTKLNTQLLRGAPQNGSGTPDTFDRLVLRAGNNRSWARSWNPDKTAYTMDEWYRATQIAMSGYGARGCFVHLYINGLYWGLYNLVERPDRWFTSEHFGGEVDDWFAISHGGNQGGERDRWDALLSSARNDLSETDSYAEVTDRLDVAGLIDYLLLSWYINLTDWPRNNWWASMDNAPEGKARFFAWDGEWSFGLGESPGRAWVHPDFRKRSQGTSTPTLRLWHGLRENSDFMAMVADRAHRHLVAEGGALTDAVAQGRWALLNDSVEEAVLAESARWGDALSPDKPRTVEEDWQNEVDRVRELMVGNGSRLIEQLRNEDYFPDLDAPQLNRFGGMVPVGSLLEIANPNTKGTIYFTTDGSDPRSPGGSVAEGAISYSEPIEIVSGANVRARVLVRSIFGGQTWSAMEGRSYYTSIPMLRVSELMYHPAAPSEEEMAAGFLNDDDFEFLELLNASDRVVLLKGFQITDGVRFVYEGDEVLDANERLVIVRNREAFEQRYGRGVRILGEYTQSLSNGGERVALRGGFGEPIQSFTYDDRWHERSDGEGASLQANQEEALDVGQWSTALGWNASATAGGSPGRSEEQDGPFDLSLRIMATEESHVVLELLGEAEATYVLEESMDLKVWTEAEQVMTGADGRSEHRVTRSESRTVFYRASKVVR